MIAQQLTLNLKCRHFWHLDEHDFGQCRWCGETRDFAVHEHPKHPHNNYLDKLVISNDYYMQGVIRSGYFGSLPQDV